MLYFTQNRPALPFIFYRKQEAAQKSLHRKLRFHFAFAPAFHYFYRKQEAARQSLHRKLCFRFAFALAFRYFCM